VELKRVLSATDAGWLVAGSMIGSGIFITPGIVAGALPGVAWPLGAWLLGGLIAMSGAAVYGELGSRIPRVGGDYQFMAAAYGPRWGFINGWAAITLTFSAAAAAQVRTALAYCAAAFPGQEAWFSESIQLTAPLMVLLLTWCNTVGARVAGKTTAFMTAIPLTILAGTFFFGASTGQVELHWPEFFVSPSHGWVFACGAALVPIYFTYSGWNAAAYLVGEMRNPGRSLARGLIVGTGLVTLVYLVINLGLILVLPQDVLAESARPAADAAQRILGNGGERVLAMMIAIAIFGSANVTLMAGARIYYAMAEDGMGPATFKRINRSGVPSTALWVGGIWAAGLAVFGDISSLVDWAVLAIMLLSSMTVSALFVLRRRDPAAGSFRCPGYPLLPALYLVVTLGAAVSSFLYDPRHALMGLAIILVGFPLYSIGKALGMFQQGP
jgi:APA family basic amino acid/polyamine antiporter